VIFHTIFISLYIGILILGIFLTLLQGDSFFFIDHFKVVMITFGLTIFGLIGIDTTITFKVLVQFFYALPYLNYGSST
jgi:hypothetical protein